MLTPEIRAAYRWRRQNNPSLRAELALDYACEDVEHGRRRYPHDRARPYPAVSWSTEDRGMAYVDDPARCGLRYVGDVEPESSRAEARSGRRLGWYTDPFGDSAPDGTGLCWGVVYQLPGSHGRVRYVAGYQHGGTSSGPALDLSRVFDAPGDDTADAIREAAWAADSMARRAADDERAYQAAWQAGSRWADLGEEIAAQRKRTIALLGEMRARRKTAPASPMICAALRVAVNAALAEISAAREARHSLADGRGDGSDELSFYRNGKREREAFCEGAGITAFPA